MPRDRSLSFSSPYRMRRFKTILEIIESVISAKGECSIIDVGGEYDYWRPFLPLLHNLPIKVLICNLDDKSKYFDDNRFSSRFGNACDLNFVSDREFDIAHSNSVIEHVGRWSEMKDMAREVGRVAHSYYVQTPYYWFPMEPHYRTIGYQWLPEQWRARWHMRRELGYFPRAKSMSEAMSWTQHAVLLDKLQMRELFSDADLRSERYFGLTKSLIAVRHSTGAVGALD